jgi:hypothetical protein
MSEQRQTADGTDTTTQSGRRKVRFQPGRTRWAVYSQDTIGTDSTEPQEGPYTEMVEITTTAYDSKRIRRSLLDEQYTAEAAARPNRFDTKSQYKVPCGREMLPSRYPCPNLISRPTTQAERSYCWSVSQKIPFQPGISAYRLADEDIVYT